MRYRVPCGGLQSTEVVTAVPQTIPSNQQAAPCRMFAFYPHGALSVVTFYFPVSGGTYMDSGKKINKVNDTRESLGILANDQEVDLSLK
jgi:hypothetical protein